MALLNIRGWKWFFILLLNVYEITHFLNDSSLYYESLDII